MTDEQPTQLKFSADSPYKICELYATGTISKERTIVELALWPYKPRPVDDGYDWLSMGSGEGSWMEVEDAERRGLIDIGIYEEAQLLKQMLTDGSKQPDIQPMPAGKDTTMTDEPAQLTFSADSPYKICELYAAGTISKERTIVELALWPYKPRPVTDGYDWLSLGSAEGTWMEVEDAAHERLIDDTIYEEARIMSEMLTDD